MKQQIFKYKLPITDDIIIEMPSEAEILSIQTQNNEACIWALVYPENPSEFRHFEVKGTGEYINDFDTDYKRKYIGTFQLNNGAFVGHLFELVY